jgi:addiction module HigA family antidote
MPKSLQSPGSFLVQTLEKYNLNPFKLSKDIQLSQSAVRMITIGKTKITTPVAMRLAKYFKTKPEYWLVMQMRWDIAEAAKDKSLMKIVKSITKVKKGEEKTTAAKKPGAKRKTTRARKSATKKRAAKPGKRGRKPATPRSNTRKVAAKRGRKPAASKARTRKVAAKRGRKAAGRRGRPAKK